MESHCLRVSTTDKRQQKKTKDWSIHGLRAPVDFVMLGSQLDKIQFAMLNKKQGYIG
jgi:hypothetical protein